MKNFLDENFLLSTPTAQRLYNDYAKDMPIIDYHCHINPREIYENRRFENLTRAWLEGDHYKWRAVRSNGIDENLITGSAGDREKFQQFAEVLPKAVGNPLYHWAHLELKRYLGIDVPLSGKTADEIWSLSLDRLSDDKLSVRGIIESSNVKVICTTDDPVDSLEWHAAIKNDPTCKVSVVPTFRPDKAVNIDKPGFTAYIQTLGKAVGAPINTLEDLQSALSKRLDFFCRDGMPRVRPWFGLCGLPPRPQEQGGKDF